MVEVTVQLPDDIARQFGGTPEEIPRRILETIALEGYRSGKLSRAQLGQLLHLDSQQIDEWLADHHATPREASDGAFASRDRNLEAFRQCLPELLQSEHGNFVAIADANRRGHRIYAQAVTTEIAFEFTLATWNLFDTSPVWRVVTLGTTRDARMVKGQH